MGVHYTQYSKEPQNSIGIYLGPSQNEYTHIYTYIYIYMYVYIYAYILTGTI